MAATLSVFFDYGGADGAPGTSINIDDLGPPSLKYKLADNASIDTSNKIVIPVAGAGPYYSALKHIYLHCDAPDGKTINNVKFWSDGSNNLGTGVDLKVGLQFPTRYYDLGADAYTGYEVATANPTTTDMVAEHSLITSSASVFDYTSTSPLAVTIEVAHQGGVIDAAHETTCYVPLQMGVANTASEGETGTEYTYFTWDEA